MDITESTATGRRCEVARERVGVCEGYVINLESQMNDLRMYLGVLGRAVAYANSGYAKARLQVLRDEVFRSFAEAEQHLICARKELARAQRVLELLEDELDKRVSDLTIPQPTTHEQ